MSTVFKIIPNMALDDSRSLFLAIASYVMPKLSPEDRKPLAAIFNNFKAARDAAIPPQNRKDTKPMPTPKEPMPKDMGQEKSIQAVMNFLRDKLSDEDIAEIARILAEGSSDPDNQPVTMAAMQELDQARADVAPVLGGRANTAMDSAARLYERALTVMCVPTQGVRDAKALRAIYRAARSNPGGRPVVAMDSARVTSLHERYPHAAKIGGV